MWNRLYDHHGDNMFPLVTPIRDLTTLVEGLAGILKDPKKASIFHYICQMLPDDVQREFDHLAAASVSNGMMSSQWSGEEVATFKPLLDAHKTCRAWKWSGASSLGRIR